MKTSLFIVSMLASAQALAGDFKVHNPIHDSQDVEISTYRLECGPGAFGSATLTARLPSAIGSMGQKGILKSKFGDLPIDACQAIIAQLQQEANHIGRIRATVTLTKRSVVRLESAERSACEGAQQEIVSMELAGVPVTESAVRSEGPLDCPKGLAPHSVNSPDKVIYVLNEDGIPTKPE